MRELSPTPVHARPFCHARSRALAFSFLHNQSFFVVSRALAFLFSFSAVWPLLYHARSHSSRSSTQSVHSFTRAQWFPSLHDGIVRARSTAWLSGRNFSAVVHSSALKWQTINSANRDQFKILIRNFGFRIQYQATYQQSRFPQTLVAATVYFLPCCSWNRQLR